MKCIETLARVDVLCVDKTGTITENTMKVQKLIKTDEYDEKEKGGLSLLVGDFAAAMTNDNITMAALKEYFTKASGKKVLSKQDFLPQQNTAALHLKTELMCSERRNLF